MHPRKVRPAYAGHFPRSSDQLGRYFALTVTLRVSVVLRPFVLSTIVNVACTVVPARILTGIVIAVLFPAAILTRALPETPLPFRLAVASTCAGQAIPVAEYFTVALPFFTVLFPDTAAVAGFERSSAKCTMPAFWAMTYRSPVGPTAMSAPLQRTNELEGEQRVPARSLVETTQGLPRGVGSELCPNDASQSAQAEPPDLDPPKIPAHERPV